MCYNFKKGVTRWNKQTRNQIPVPFIKYLISPSGSFLTTQPMSLSSLCYKRSVYVSILASIWHVKGLIIFWTHQATYLEKLQLPRHHSLLLDQVVENMLTSIFPVTSLMISADSLHSSAHVQPEKRLISQSNRKHLWECAVLVGIAKHICLPSPCLSYSRKHTDEMQALFCHPWGCCAEAVISLLESALISQSWSHFSCVFMLCQRKVNRLSRLREHRACSAVFWVRVVKAHLA